jgi:hypothetical protein
MALNSPVPRALLFDVFGTWCVLELPMSVLYLPATASTGVLLSLVNSRLSHMSLSMPQLRRWHPPSGSGSES